MRPLALLISLCLAACGGDPADEGGADNQSDPAACSIPTGEVKVNSGVPDDEPSYLDCTDDALACEGATSLTQTKCSDGFAVTLERGKAKLRLRLKGADAWTAGAELNGETFTGSLSMMGLYNPAEPAPAAGTKQRGSFFLASDQENATGVFSVEW